MRQGDLVIARQGDIVEFDFNPSIGHEPKGRRPGLVVSTDRFSLGTSMSLICPITTTDNGFPLHLRLPDDVGEVYGYVVTEQVRAFDLASRNARLLVHLDADGEFMRDVVSVVKSFY